MAKETGLSRVKPASGNVLLELCTHRVCPSRYVWAAGVQSQRAHRQHAQWTFLRSG